MRKLLTLDKPMASLSTCHLELLFGMAILLKIVQSCESSVYIQEYIEEDGEGKPEATCCPSQF